MNYQQCRVGDHCLVGDGAHGSLKRLDDGVPYLTAKDIRGRRLELSNVYRIAEETFTKHFRGDSRALTLPLAGDVIFGIIGSLGQAYRVKPGDRFGLSSSIAMLRPNPSMLDSDYLYYWVTGPQFQQAIHAIKGGVAQSYISLEMIRALPLSLPSLARQREIAATLFAYDDLIENNTRRIAILEEMARRIYEEWFVRFRFPGHENVRMVESELGPVPEGWAVREVKDIVRRLPAGRTYKESDVSSAGSVPVVDQSTAELLGFHDDEPGHRGSSEKPVVIFGDHTCKMRLMVTPFSLGPNTVPFVANELPVHYVYPVVRGLVTTHEYKRHWSDFMKKSVIVAASPVATHYAEAVRPLAELDETLRRKNRNLRTTRDLLLPKLISGELDVSALAEPVAA